MAQTTVSALMESIFGKDFRLTVSNDILNEYQILVEMHKRQIKNAYEHGQNNGWSYHNGNSSVKLITGEDYYEQTYGTE